MTTPTTTAVPSAISQRTVSSSAATGKSGSGVQAVLTPGLAATQRNANFGKTPLEQPHVIDMMKACYRMNGTEEISDALNALIDGLVKKVEEGGGQKAEELKSMIVEILKKADPAPASSSSFSFPSDATTATPSISAVESSSLAATPTTSAQLAKPETGTKPSSSWLRWIGSFFSAAQDQAAALNALQQAAVKEGVPAKLAQYHKQLELDKVTKRIAELPDTGSLEQVLNDVDGRVKTLVAITSNEKKSIVDLVRKADLSNRKQGQVMGVQKSVIEAFHSAGGALSASGGSAGVSNHAEAKVVQKWYRAAKSQQVMHEKAVQGYKMIQSKLESSVRDVVGPNKNILELSQVELSELGKKLDEWGTREREKKSELQEQLEQTGQEQDGAKVSGLLTDLDTCEKNIKGIEDQKKKIATLSRTVGLAEMDLRVINSLSDRFAAAPGFQANALPCSLPLLANGVESPSVKDGFSLNKALEYGRAGASSRSAALKIGLSEFGSWFNTFDSQGKPRPSNTRGEKLPFLAELGGSLKNPGGERSEKVLKFLGTADCDSPQGLDKNGRIFIHKLAAANVSAAGFNSKTLALSAPSLAYKVESSYSRKSQEHVGARLKVLESLSGTLQAEIFKAGKPVDITHAVITDQHAVEAASLILAAMPNDLLTTNHAEVERFMKALKAFENKVELAGQQNNGQVGPKDLESFKQELSTFHKKAALWISERDTAGAEQSLAAAREISKEIAENRRGGVLRRISVNVGNFVNLAGGKAIRESFSAIQNYFSNVNQKERLRQQLGKTENIATVFELKAQLKPLLSSADASNAQVLINYLEGKSLTVKLQGQLSPQLKRTLVEVESFVQKLWKSCGHGKPLPKVIEWSSSLDQSPSKLLVGAANDQPIKVNRSAGSAKTSSPIKPMSEIAIIDKLLSARGRKIQEVSGQGNRCWLRAANASAISYSDIQDVSQRVFDALEKVKADWVTKIQPDANKAGMLIDGYEPYWPANVDEVKNIYQALVAAKDLGYRIGDAQVENNLQKMTLQLAIPRLTGNVLDIVGTPRPIKNEGTTEANSFAKNLKELSGMAEVQGDRQIITAFLESIDSKVDFISDRDRVKDLDSKQGKNDTVLLKHSGSSVHSGHYRFYSKHN
ncbi:hypothetical protein [Limnobacter sp.]|nr:hypothetical protein [Limnobacter sp.]